MSEIVWRLEQHGDKFIVGKYHYVKVMDRNGKLAKTLLSHYGLERCELLGLRSGGLLAIITSTRVGVYLHKFDAVGRRLGHHSGLLVFAHEVEDYNTRTRGWDDLAFERDEIALDDEEYFKAYQERKAAFMAPFGTRPRGYEWCGMVELPNGCVLLALSISPYIVVDDLQVEAQTVLLRLHRAGNLDKTFGSDGRLEIKSRAGEPLYMSQMTGLRGGGVLLVGAPANSKFTYVLKLDATGQMDNSFADEGELKVAYSGLDALHETEDGTLYGHCDIDRVRLTPTGLWPIVKITPTGRIDNGYHPVLPQKMTCRVMGVRGNSVILRGTSIVPDGRLHFLTVDPDGHLLRHNFVRYNEDNEVRTTRFLFCLTDDGRLLINMCEQVAVYSDSFKYNVTEDLKAYRL